MDYAQIMREIENLNQQLLLVDDTLKHNVNVFWAALGIGLTLIGLLSLGWVRYFVANEVGKRLKDEVDWKMRDRIWVYDPKTPTLLNGWRGYHVHYWKDGTDYVTLEGIVYGGASGHEMMRFAKGYTPNEELKVPLICSEGNGYCMIGLDGIVTIHAHPDAHVRFGSIQFKAK